MTPLGFRGPHRANAVPPVSRAEVRSKAEALEGALALMGDTLPAVETEHTRTLLRRVEERSSLAGEHTVVALAGATGSGKSSVFNALVGSPVTQVAARRPTTSRASAAIWGESSAGALLDWLDVPTRHAVSDGDATLDGLVLLDLPDFDSRQAENRAEADRVLARCDVFVWVTDPQKYADAILHEDYVSRLATSRATSVVVLNQVDRLSPDAADACRNDLRRLLDDDGLPDAEVLPASATSAGGVDALREALATVVQTKNAADQRLVADLREEARRLSSFVGAAGSRNLGDADDELVRALGAAAGVPVVLDAVERHHLVEAARQTGWPFTRWTRRLKPRPLARLGLDRLGRQDDASLSPSEKHVVPGRSSLPAATPSARASVDLATRRLSDRAAQGLPPAWAEEVHETIGPWHESIADELDQAVLATPLRSRRPGWWSAVSVLQWMFAAAALVGAVWVLALIALNAMQIHVGVPSFVGDWSPIPIVLLVAGLALGLLLALLARALARRGAARAREQARARLDVAVEQVARQHVIEPVDAVLRRHDEAARMLAEASA